MRGHDGFVVRGGGTCGEADPGFSCAHPGYLLLHTKSPYGLELIWQLSLGLLALVGVVLKAIWGGFWGWIDGYAPTKKAGRVELNEISAT